MPKIVIASDKFKGSATASEVADALGQGLREVLGEDSEMVTVPVADGGDGIVEAATSTFFSEHQCTVTSAYSDQAMACFGYDQDSRTAVIEVAQACGLALRSPDLGDPTAEEAAAATSYGVGQLLGAALDAGATRLVLGLGGSATTDGGAGMAAALGARIADASGSPIGPGGARLADAASVDLAGLDPRLARAEVVIASDVVNPLCGPEGAAAVYGPQKGLTEAWIEKIDAHLARYAQLVEGALHVPEGSFSRAAGAGAAGGLGFACLAFLGGTMRSGIQEILDLVGFDEAVAGADLVITGEGRLDRQTLQGKAPAGVAERAAARGIPVVMVCGASELTAADLEGTGIARVHALTDLETDPQRCLREPLPLLRETGRRIAREFSTDVH